MQVFAPSYKEGVETDPHYFLHCLFIRVKDGVSGVYSLLASFMYSLRKEELWYIFQELWELQSIKSDTVEFCPELRYIWKEPCFSPCHLTKSVSTC